MSDVLYIVIPCYNEEAVLPETIWRFGDKLTRLTNSGLVDAKSRILFVDDGSSDKTWDLIRQANMRDARFSGLSLSRNNGQQNALIAGLMFARDRCDVAITIDADLQHDLNTIDDMLMRYSEGIDIVYGVRADGDPKLRCSRAFYRLMGKLGTPIIYNHSEYRLMSRRVLDGLSEFSEVNLFLRGMMPMIGYSSDTIIYQQEERFAGETKYSFKKLLELSIEAITSLSVTPLRLIGMVGISVLVISLIVFVYGMLQQDSLTIIAGSIWSVGGLILTSLGVIGEYIGKIYLETKKRPRYFIRECVESKNNKEKKP
jgi:glycosyltransferase involved in cell wall biosynthesis